jgi:hypothetical protein
MFERVLLANDGNVTQLRLGTPRELRNSSKCDGVVVACSVWPIDGTDFPQFEVHILHPSEYGHLQKWREGSLAGSGGVWEEGAGHCKPARGVLSRSRFSRQVFSGQELAIGAW